MNFQKGDIVEWGGVQGEVICVNRAHGMTINFHPNGRTFSFSGFKEDGKLYDWQTESVLKFIKRMKKIEGWINIYEPYPTMEELVVGDMIFKTKEEADSSISNKVACVPIEFEIEEKEKV